LLITNVQGIELVLTGTASFGLNPFASTSQQWNAIDKEGLHINKHSQERMMSWRQYKHAD
jgi:hypothetical protein